jgi:hypothetical protein
VPAEDKKRAAHRALVDRILNGEGRASPEQRARAFRQARRQTAVRPRLVDGPNVRSIPDPGQGTACPIRA